MTLAYSLAFLGFFFTAPGQARETVQMTAARASSRSMQARTQPSKSNPQSTSSTPTSIQSSNQSPTQSPANDPAKSISNSTSVEPSPDRSDSPAQQLGADGGILSVLEVHPQGLTAEQVAQAAVLEAPTIAMKRAQLAVTASNIEGTMNQFFPRFGVTATYRRINQTTVDFGGNGATVVAGNEGPIITGPCPDNPTFNCALDAAGQPVIALGFPPIKVPADNYSLVGNLSIPISDYALRLMHARKGSNSERESSKLAHDAEVVQVEMQARVAFYDWMRVLARVAVAERTLTRTKARLNDAKAGFHGGIATQADVLRLDGMVAASENAVAQVKQLERLAAQNLSAVMGTSDQHYEVGEDVLSPVELPFPPGSREQLIKEGQQNRLEVRALNESLVALKHGVGAARAGLYPQLNAFGEIDYSNPNQRFFPATQKWRASWAVGVSLGWQLGQFMQSRAQIHQLEAQGQVSRAQVATIQQAVKLEVNSAWSELIQAQTSLGFVQRSLASSQAAYEQTAALYQAGESTTTDVIDAEAEHIQASLQMIDAHIDMRIAVIKLLHASGRMKPIVSEVQPSATTQSSENRS